MAGERKKDWKKEQRGRRGGGGGSGGGADIETELSGGLRISCGAIRCVKWFFRPPLGHSHGRRMY